MSYAITVLGLLPSGLTHWATRWGRIETSVKVVKARRGKYGNELEVNIRESSLVEGSYDQMADS